MHHNRKRSLFVFLLSLARPINRQIESYEHDRVKHTDSGFVNFSLNVHWSRCAISYYEFCCINLSVSGLITSVGEERASFSTIDYL